MRITPEVISCALSILERETIEEMFVAVGDNFFRMNEECCKNSIAKNWLKSEKKGKSQFPSKLKRVHFKDEILDVITLLHQVVGNAYSKYFEFWMCRFILIICSEKQIIEWAEIISYHLNEQLIIFWQTVAFHMCSYMVYILASQEAVLAGLEPQGYPTPDTPVYKSLPQLTKQVGMRDLCCVNDTFLMEIVRRLDRNPELWVSPKAVAMVMRFKSFLYSV